MSTPAKGYGMLRRFVTPVRVLLIGAATVSVLQFTPESHLNAQQAVYENFNSGIIRQFTGPGGPAPLYHEFESATYNACPEQSSAIENGEYVVRTQDCQGVMDLYWYAANTRGGWDSKNIGYWQGWLLPGQNWNPAFNRFSFRFRCDYPATFSPWSNLHIGTFAKDLGAPANFSETDNYHFYHFVSFNMTPYRWIYLTINDKPNHQRSGSNDMGLKVNPTRFPAYFDNLTKSYINFSPNASVNYGACYFDDLVFRTESSGEPDWYVSSLTGQYTGTRYEVAWQTPAPLVLTYDVRYSTAGSLKASGWSAGTSGGTVASRGDAYVGVLWASSNMAAQTGGMWVAIRPRLRAQAIVSGATTAVQMYGHGLQVGDEIACTGLTGLTPSSFTTTVSAVTDWQNVTLNQATSGAYTPMAGYCHATSETARFTEFYIPPDPVSAPMPPTAAKVTGVTTSTASLSWTRDPMTTSTVIERSITGANKWTQAGTSSGTTFTDTGLDSATSYDYRFRGVNAQGTSGPTQVAVSAVTNNGVNAPSIITSSLPEGTIGQAYSQTIGASGGSSPYTWSLMSGTLPDGLTFSNGVISGTSAVITTQMGNPIRVRVAGADGAAASVALSVAINAAFPATDPLTNFSATYVKWRFDQKRSAWLSATPTGVHTYTGCTNGCNANWGYGIGWYANDQYSQAQIVTLPSLKEISPNNTGANARMGVGVRQGANQVQWGCVVDQANVCARTAALSGTPIRDSCVSTTVKVGDYIRADVEGPKLTCSLNGTPITTATITTTSGNPGILTDSKTGILANWSGGPRPSTKPPRHLK